MAVQQYPWAQIEAEYVTGDITLQNLAEKYGCCRNIMYKHSRLGGWNLKRSSHRQKTMSKTLEASQNSGAASLTKIIEAATGLTEKVAAAIQFAENALTLKDCQTAAHTLESIGNLLMKTCRISTASEETARELALSRIEIERERLSMEKEKLSQGANGGVAIEIAGEADGYAE